MKDYAVLHKNGKQVQVSFQQKGDLTFCFFLFFLLSSLRCLQDINTKCNATGKKTCLICF